MLLASGVKTQARTIVPILIDPDNSNGDLERTREILSMYQHIWRKLQPDFKHNQFFQTEIKTLGNLESTGTEAHHASEMMADSFLFDIDGTRDGVFKQFIGYSTLNENSRALVDALFSESNLDADLSVGFKGNPHMGSIVLNQFKDSREFKFFASRFGPNDRIFVISSIFGGTGAAGFPLLVKNIRNADESLPNFQRLRESKIGAITVTPYFGVMPDENITINKATFITKAKAALEYYDRHLSGNGSLNALYYIGDEVTKDQKAAEGRKAQMNQAHLVELISALAVLDFASLPDQELKTNKTGKAETPIFKEYGLIDHSNTMNLSHLGPVSRQKIGESLTQYVYACNYWRNHLDQALAKPETWAKSPKTPFNTAMTHDAPFRTSLQKFNEHFQVWLGEMAGNERSFKPFDWETDKLHALVFGYDQVKRGLFGGAKEDSWDYANFTHELDRAEGTIPAIDTERRFMAIFWTATRRIVQERLKNLVTA